jgi:hypothetical protein
MDLASPDGMDYSQIPPLPRRHRRYRLAANDHAGFRAILLIVVLLITVVFFFILRIPLGIG